MTGPTEPAYWEDWARDLGWDAEKVDEAGRIGSLAVTRGAPPQKAMDIVLARVRDGREVPIGPSLISRTIASIVDSGTLFAAAALAVGLWLHFGTGFFVYFPVATALTVVAAVGLAVKNASRRNWILPVVTVVLSVATVVLLATPSNS